MLYAGFTKIKALLFNFLTGLFAILGTLVALLVGSRVEDSLCGDAAIGGRGIYLYRRVRLVSELNKESDLLKSVVQLIAIAVGVGLMLLVAMLESR